MKVLISTFVPAVACPKPVNRSYSLLALGWNGFLFSAIYEDDQLRQHYTSCFP